MALGFDYNTFGPSGGMTRGPEWGTTAPKPPTNTVQPGQQNPLGGIYGVYNTAVGTQAKDYGNIMNQYGQLASSTANQPVATQTYSPQTYTYAPTQQAMNSIGTLGTMTQTGGYNPGDLQAIRSRATQPIRSVYDSASRNIDRNVSLRGGSGLGYQATKAKMARDMAQQISDATINSEAAIAGDVARNKINIAPSYASAAGAESSLKNQYGARATDVINEASRFNAQSPYEAARINQQGVGNQADILRGETSLYGTTPALASLYGSQALNSAQLQQQNEENNRRLGTNIVSQILGSLR